MLFPIFVGVGLVFLLRARGLVGCGRFAFLLHFGVVRALNTVLTVRHGSFWRWYGFEVNCTHFGVAACFYVLRADVRVVDSKHVPYRRCLGIEFGGVGF